MLSRFIESLLLKIIFFSLHSCNYDYDFIVIGSLDPRCKSTELKCGFGIPRDPRCPNPTPTAEPATYLPPFTVTNFKTTKSPIATSTSASQIACAPNSLDPRCKTAPTTKPIPRISDEGLSTICYINT